MSGDTNTALSISDNPVLLGCVRVEMDYHASYTTPGTIEEIFSLSLSNCKAKVLSLEKKGYGMYHALVDLGTHECVQEALRIVNGAITEEGKRIVVRMSLKSFTAKPGNTLRLYAVPTGYHNYKLYDKLACFGTVVSLTYTNPSKASPEWCRALATFLTMDQAQTAVQALKSDKHFRPIEAKICKKKVKGVASSTSSKKAKAKGRKASKIHAASEKILQESSREKSAAPVQTSLDTLDDLHTVHATDDEVEPDWLALNLSPIASDEMKRQVVREYLHQQYERKIRPSENLEKIINVLENSLDLAHLLAHCTNRGRFRIYMAMTKNALREEKSKIVPLSNRALAVAEQLNVARFPLSGQLPIIREHLLRAGKGHYTDIVMKHIVRIILPQLCLPTLLELCAYFTKFRIMVFHVKVSVQRRIDFAEYSLSEGAKSLILQLSLDKESSIESWKQALRTHAFSRYKEKYGETSLSQILETMVDAMAWPDFLYRFLEMCVDPQWFPVFVIVAQIAIENRCAFKYEFEANHLVAALELEKLEDVSEWKKVLRQLMIPIYWQKFGDHQKEKELEMMVNAVKTPAAFYKLLHKCADDYNFHCRKGKYAPKTPMERKAW